MHDTPSPALVKLLKFNAMLAEKYGPIPTDIRHPTLAEYYAECEVQKNNRETRACLRAWATGTYADYDI